MKKNGRLTIKQKPLADLTPYARNPRTHSDSQIDQIVASIQEFGWTNPVLIDEEGGIIAGHGRVMAAEKLGLSQVPTITLAHLTKAQRRAYVIADNKLALNGGWNDQLLRLELSELGDDGFDLPLLGFSDLELDALAIAGLDEMPTLPEGDRAPFRQMTFILHDSQADLVERALRQAKADGKFEDSPNENSNGNALARICGEFVERQKPSDLPH